MSQCRDPSHYPQPVSPGEYDSHLHAAGRVALVDGVPAVVDPSACSRKWRTLVVDPPWAFDQSWLTGRYLINAVADGKASKPWPAEVQRRHYKRGAVANYSTMTIEQLAAMPLESWAEDKAHLYVWTTNSFVREAHDLAEAWGFQPKTMLTWVKPRLGMGTYFRNNTEHVVFAVKGALKVLRHDVRTAFTAEQGRHSEKPAAFYDLVESVSPGPFLDVFARSHRFNWSSAGNEVYSAIPELAYQPPQPQDTENPRTDE